MTWCLQCGIQGRTEKAIGKDEDGEDACALHRDKSRDVAPITTFRPQPPAKVVKPVPAVQPEKSKAMAVSKGLRPKSECEVCGKEIADFLMNRHMAAKHGTEPKVRKSKKESVAFVELKSEPKEGQSIEPEVVVYLKQSQVRKLLQLLLQ